MSDLVSGLLAKLDEEEAAANRMCHSNPDDGGYYSCPAVHTEQYGDRPWGEDACDCRLKQRRESILRLCRAHRDIIDIWKYSFHAKSKYQTPETVERWLTMNEIVEALARGLGVEEQSSE